MPQTGIQEWLAFAVFGIALVLTGLISALPAAAESQHVALGVLFIYVASIGLFATSPTVAELLTALEDGLSRSDAGE